MYSPATWVIVFVFPDQTICVAETLTGTRNIRVFFNYNAHMSIIFAIIRYRVCIFVMLKNYRVELSGRSLCEVGNRAWNSTESVLLVVGRVV